MLMEAFLLWSVVYRKLTSWRYNKYKIDLLTLSFQCKPHDYKELWSKTGKFIKYKNDRVNVIQSLGETWKTKVADCNGYAYLAAQLFGNTIEDNGYTYVFMGIYCGTDFKSGHYVTVYYCAQTLSTIYVDNQELEKGWAWKDRVSRYKYLFRLNSDLKIIGRMIWFQIKTT